MSFFEKEINGFDISIDAPFSLFVDDEELPKDKWDYTLEDRQKAVIYPEPKDPATIITFVVNAAATYAVNYAITALFGTTDNYNETIPEGSSIYSVNSQGNSARLNGIVPQLFGTHAYYPDLISQSWTQYEDDIEYLYMLFSCGIGQYDFDEINISNTPVSRYLGDIDYTIFQPNEDVTSHPAHRNIYTSSEVAGFELTSGGYSELGTIMPDGLEYDFTGDTVTAIEQVDDGLGGFIATPYNWPYAVGDLVRFYTSFNSGIYKVSAVSTNVLTLTDEEDEEIIFTDRTAEEAIIQDVESVIEGDWFGPFLACPLSEKTSNLYIDILFPEGLIQYNDEGESFPRAINYYIAYREYNASNGDEDGWTQIYYEKLEETADELGDTIALEGLPLATYEVRARRWNTDSTSLKVKDTVQWTRLKSELEANTSYEHWTTLAVKIRGTNALSSSAQNKFNTVQTRKLPIYDAVTETWSDATATQDIAPAFSYIIKDSGLDDSVLDLENMDDLNTIWAGREDLFQRCL